MTTSLFVVVIGMIGVAIASWARISPIQISDIEANLERFAANRLPDGVSIDIGRADFIWNGGFDGTLTLSDVRLSDDQSNQVVLPHLSTLLNMSDLLRRRIKVRTVVIENGELTLDLNDLKAAHPRALVAADVGSDTSSHMVPTRPDHVSAEAFHLIDTVRREANALGLESLELERWTLYLSDRETGWSNRFDEVDGSLFLTDGMADVTLTANGFVGRWRAVVSSRGVLGADLQDLSVSISDLTAVDLIGHGENHAVSVPDGLSAPVYLRLKARQTESGVVERLRIEASAAASHVIVKENEITFKDGLSGHFEWDAERRALIVQQADIQSGRNAGRFRGAFVWPDPAAGLKDAPIDFQFRAVRASVGPSDVKLPPLWIPNIAISGQIDRANGQIDFNTVRVKTVNAEVNAAGSLRFTGDLPAISIAATLKQAEMSAVKQMWPSFIAPKTRRWVIGHMERGVVSEARLQAVIPLENLKKANDGKVIIPDEALDGRFDIEGATLTPLTGMPPIRDVEGTIDVTGKTVNIVARSGTSGEKTHQLDVSGATFTISDLDAEPIMGHLGLEAKGSTRALAHILDSEALKILRKHEIDPDGINGNVSGFFEAQMPLSQDAALEDVDYALRLKLNRFSSASKINGRTVKSGQLSVAVDNTELSINGRANLDGLAADVDVVQTFGELASNVAKSQLQVRLTDADRRKSGLDFGDRIEGPIVMTVGNDTSRSSGAQHIDVDLSSATLRIPELGWTKGAGVPAQASFELVETSRGFDVKNLLISGNGFKIAGSGTLDKKNRLRQLDLKSVTLRKGDRFDVKLRATAKAAYKVSISGKQIDIRGLLKEGSGSSASDTSSSSDRFEYIDLALDLDRVVGEKERVMTDVNGRARLRPFGLSSAEISGLIGSRNAPVNVTTSDNGPQRKVSISTRDAGAFLRFAGIYEDLAGGALSLTSTRIPENGKEHGIFEIKNFLLSDSATVNKLTETAQSIRATNSPEVSAAAVAGGDALRFERFLAFFDKTDDRVVIRKGRVSGPVVGATLSGQIDLAQRNLNVTGTYVPIFGLNNLFQQVPLFGRILGNRKGEGLLGVTYRLAGPLEQPQLAINPVSAVAPGIFRSIFEFNSGNDTTPRPRTTPLDRERLEGGR